MEAIRLKEGDLAFFCVATLRSAHSTERLACFRSRATSRQILTGIDEFYGTASKKPRCRWRVSCGLSAYAHEPAQTTNTPDKKTKQNQTLERKNPCKLNNQ
jgi:hypothetical protein